MGVGGPRGAQTQSFSREGRPIPAMNKPKDIFDMLFDTKITKVKYTQEIHLKGTGQCLAVVSMPKLADMLISIGFR